MGILEIFPLIIFFALSKYYGIIIATGGLVASSLAVFVISYLKKKTIQKSAVISLILLVLFGLLTIAFNNPMFIKVKLTIVSLIFSAILFYGFYSKKTFMKKMLGAEVQKFGVNNKQWQKFDLSWAFYFFLLAILNEIIWRNFSEEIWVNFKVFGTTGLLLVFCIITFAPLIKSSKKQ
jgi:intracellular septation protein